MVRKQCEHGRIYYSCVKCKGPGVCEHNIVRTRCIPCKGGSVCLHGTLRFRCVECAGSSICVHGKDKYGCGACVDAKKPCKHNLRKSMCAECKSIPYVRSKKINNNLLPLKKRKLFKCK